MHASPWLMAIRPRTLILSLSPVAVGGALARSIEGRIDSSALIAAALAAALIQIATNLFNDARDFEHGADGPDRLGPPRAAASGLLSPRAIKSAAYGCFGFAALLGLFLALRGGWPIVLLGLASLLSGWAYSGGPRPISHSPFGEVFVIAFFGLGAVGGAFWLCALKIGAPALIAGLALGLFAGAVLMINNIRDARADARNGRRTLAIVAGPRRAQILFGFMVLAPFALLAPLAYTLPAQKLWLALAALPFAVQLLRKMGAESPGPRMNALLARAAALQGLYAALLTLGALV